MLATVTLLPRLTAAADRSVRRPLKKGIMWGTVKARGSVLDKMNAVKQAGFEAVEMSSHMNQEEVLRARDATGLEIASVCGDRHWKEPLSHPDPTVRASGLKALHQTLRDAKVYGTDSILLVPGVVKDGVTYQECWDRSIAQIRPALPLAEELGVNISIENVWNNFITTPQAALRYLDVFDSPWVGWQFDCGNIIRYGDPIDWIRALGKRINRVHIKEYSRDLAMRTGDVWAGFRVPLLQGANNWSGIMQALDDIGYLSYLITEQNGDLTDLSAALEKILAS